MEGKDYDLLRDHDLLIEINTKLSRAILDIDGIKSDAISRLIRVEEMKISKEDFAKTINELSSRVSSNGKRLNILEKIAYGVGGVVIALELFFKFIYPLIEK